MLFDRNIVRVGLWQLNMAECCICWSFCPYRKMRCTEAESLMPVSWSDENPVGAWLAREECTAVFQVLRVIVLRGQATLPQVLRLNLPALGRKPLFCVQNTAERTNEVTVFSTPGIAEISFQTRWTRSGEAALTRSIRSNSPLKTSH